MATVVIPRRRGNAEVGTGQGPLVLGCDVGGTSIKWAVMDGERIANSGERPTPLTGESDVVDALAGICSGAGTLRALGIGMPAVVDSARGRVSAAPNLPGAWSGYALVDEVEQRCGVRAVLANDARCFALAEWQLGAARGQRHAIFVTLGTGVGGAVIAGGALLTGRGGHAGELGHITVDPAGPRCGCGARGCVEVYASGPAIAAAAVRGVLQGLSTTMRLLPEDGIGVISPPAVLAAAKRGDPLALKVLEHAAAALGRALAPAVLVVEPDVVVIGGGLIDFVGLMAPTLQAAMAENLHVFLPPTIVPAALGRFGGAMGAALWATTRQS